METNPIFRLELIQLRRGRIFLLLFFGGCVSQAAGLALRLNIEQFGRIVSSFGFGFYLVNLFFKLLPIFIVGWASLKLAAQQVEDDPILRTPLSPKTVLAGKLKAVFVMILCLYVSAIPLYVYGLFTEEGHAFSLLLWPCNIGILLCWAMIGMGFMAGARSPILRGVLAALCVFFIVDLYVFGSLLYGVVWRSMTDWYLDAHSSTGINQTKVYFCYTILELMRLALMTILAVLFFRMGTAVMRPNPDRRMKPLFRGAGLTAALGSLALAIVVGLMMSLSGNYTPPIVFIVPWAILVFLPPVAMYAVKVHDRRDRNPGAVSDNEPGTVSSDARQKIF